MKKLFIPTLFLLLLAAACSNDFEVGAPWKEIPITYAILDADAPAQYIRVEKAFLGDESALKIAKIADSLYYPADAITVFLERLNASGNTVKTYEATRVDGRDEGFVRDTGIFATQPNWLYKVVTTGSDSLVEGEVYRVRIKRKNGQPDITGSTRVPHTFRWADPLSNTIYGSPTFPKIAFDTSGVFTVSWRCDASGVYFNTDLVVRYHDSDPSTGKIVAEHEFHWPIGRNVERRSTPSSTAPPLTFSGSFKSGSLFQEMKKNIPESNTLHRYFDRFSLSLVGGGAEIKLLNESLSANSGITSAEIISQFTNMSEGFGIITAKNKIVSNNLGIENYSNFIEIIQRHHLTKNLNFKI